MKEMYNVEPQINDAYAHILGEPVLELPEDLYIPKDALQVFLESFTGPLDLLLYLIRKQNIDILDIPIAKITAQYLEYLDLKDKFQIELAAEYLVMATTLAEIKSRMLLPKPHLTHPEEEDPRVELVRRLQEYERFKKLAESLKAIPRLERDIWIASAELPQLEIKRPLPKVHLIDLISALRATLARAKLFEHHHIKRDNLTVRERMSQILTILSDQKFTQFSKLFKLTEGRIGVIVTFIALLELLRQTTIEIVQNNAFAIIHVKTSDRL